MKKLAILAIAGGLLATALSSAPAQDFYFWNMFQCAADDTCGYRAKDPAGNHFNGVWSFWWDEGTADTLFVTAYDLYKDSHGNIQTASTKVCTLLGGWTYADFLRADSVVVDTRECSKAVYMRVIGDKNDWLGW